MDIEYKFNSNLNKILTSLNYMYPKDKAGNNIFHNEKIDFFNDWNN